MADVPTPIKLSVRRRLLQRPILCIERAQSAIERLYEAVAADPDDIQPALRLARTSVRVAAAVLQGRLLELQITNRISGAATPSTSESAPSLEESA